MDTRGDPNPDILLRKTLLSFFFSLPTDYSSDRVSGRKTRVSSAGQVVGREEQESHQHI
jgi:hypothetical protein